MVLRQAQKLWNLACGTFALLPGTEPMCCFLGVKSFALCWIGAKWLQAFSTAVNLEGS